MATWKCLPPWRAPKRPKRGHNRITPQIVTIVVIYIYSCYLQLFLYLFLFIDEMNLFECCIPAYCIFLVFILYLFLFIENLIYSYFIVNQYMYSKFK